MTLSQASFLIYYEWYSVPLNVAVWIHLAMVCFIIYSTYPWHSLFLSTLYELPVIKIKISVIVLIMSTDTDQFSAASWSGLGWSIIRPVSILNKSDHDNISRFDRITLILLLKKSCKPDCTTRKCQTVIKNHYCFGFPVITSRHIFMHLYLKTQITPTKTIRFCTIPRKKCILNA